MAKWFDKLFRIEDFDEDENDKELSEKMDNFFENIHEETLKEIENEMKLKKKHHSKTDGEELKFEDLDLRDEKVEENSNNDGNQNDIYEYLTEKEKINQEIAEIKQKMKKAKTLEEADELYEQSVEKMKKFYLKYARFTGETENL